ncbi:splicing factor, proline- and glutamine-rich-like [Sarcophilus harrisii]|uniref:splicing factor, proline- and glutamine-rich-like n=1 Tax=Sarcophilus harrisii TaxID=9305 RepID=UPI001301EE2F|nr:splicing factor, proline- and glutamine-rich-like [Sarcophilus harrisii]
MVVRLEALLIGGPQGKPAALGASGELLRHLLPKACWDGLGAPDREQNRVSESVTPCSRRPYSWFCSFHSAAGAGPCIRTPHLWLPEPGPQELCTFVSAVAAQVLQTLQPRKPRPPRRKSAPRRLPYSPPYRMGMRRGRGWGGAGLGAGPAEPSALTHPLLPDPPRSSAHGRDAPQRPAQQGPGPQARPRLPRPPSPFLGVAQALTAPESPGPGLALSAGALQSPAHELAEIVPPGPGPSLLPAVTEDPSGCVRLPPDPAELPLEAPVSPLLALPAAIAEMRDPGPCPTRAVGTWVRPCRGPEPSRPLLC